MSEPWTASATGVVVTVRLTPRGGRDALDGVATLADGQTVLKARVRAAPTEGEANAALIALLAKAAEVPKGSVGLIAGQTARIKRLAIAGDPAALIAALSRSIATP
jgi:uncharacterized protein YggU (UPF0235/DUF167 family)